MPLDPTLTLYWRPACGFCASLRRQMDGAGLQYREVNIWDEPDAASTVRDYARGNETVPTVVIGEPGSADAVGLVNPALAEVLDALGRRG